LNLHLKTLATELLKSKKKRTNRTNKQTNKQTNKKQQTNIQIQEKKYTREKTITNKQQNI